MEEVLEIVLRAIDDASSIFGSVSQSAEEMGSAMEQSATEATQGFDEIDESATTATGSIQDIIDYCQNIDGSGPRDAAGGMDELDNATSTADAAVEDLGTDLNIINAGMLLQTAEQIGAIAGNAENMAQEMNGAAITVGQLATQTGVAEPQMVALVNTISNATFPNDEAMMYIKSLDQMGVSADNLGESATNIDRINDAFGLGAQTTNSLAQELGVLGVDMNNVSSAFNALAYANANTVGGMENYYTFLRKYDAEFKELGFNVDQASVIIAAATQKFGGGKAALSGLNEALKESNGDTRKLEEALGMQAGSIENASQLTGEYAGQLDQLAGEEAEHKTLLDQLGAAWEDFSLSMSGVLSPLGSAIGLIGEVGSFGMQVNGLKMLGSSLKGVVTGLRDFNAVKAITNAIEGEGAVASIAAALGITTEAAAADTAAFSFGGLAIAEGAALWPILAIIAAIALLVVAVYEIGKAFDWWDDVGSMLEAIQAGIMRLWSAFINHPDVQAAISAITGALQWLWGAIQNAGQALMEFLGIGQGGEFDIVRAIIDGLGVAWNAMTVPIRTVIGVIQLLIPYLQNLYEGVLVPLGEFLVGVFTPVWQLLVNIWALISPSILSITNAFSMFASGQMSLPGLIQNVMTNLWNIYTTIFGMIGRAVLSWGKQMISRGLSAARGFVTNIVNQIMRLPFRVNTYLLNVVQRIIAVGQMWISNAKSKAQAVVDGAAGALAALPGRIASALGGVVDAIVKPFRDAYNAAKQVWDKIVNMANNTPSVSAQGGDAMGGDWAPMGGDFEVSSNDTVTLEHNLNISLDLANVPSHISTEQLVSALTDRNVLRELVNNRDFQLLDSRAKERLNLKVNRARGV